MRFNSFKHNNKLIESEKDIKQILNDNYLTWLLNCEFEDAIIEIENNTIVWKGGNMTYGIWKYGIWESGSFNGIWQNGIFVYGNFNGKFLSGIVKGGIHDIQPDDNIKIY